MYDNLEILRHSSALIELCEIYIYSKTGKYELAIPYMHYISLYDRFIVNTLGNFIGIKFFNLFSFISSTSNDRN